MYIVREMEDSGELSRAKQSGAEAEQSRADRSRAEHNRAEQSRADGRPRRAGQLVKHAKGSQ